MFVRTALLAAAAAAAAPATAAAAPTLAPLKPCYVSIGVNEATGKSETEWIAVQGSGFTPNAVVDISIDGVVAISGRAADAAGNLALGYVQAPLETKGERDFVLNVTEQANPAQTVSVPSKISVLRVSARPRQAKPSRRITFTGRGFTDAGDVWMHYVKGTRHKRTVKLAKPQGPCGTFTSRRRQFPFNPSTGRWIAQIDQQRKYSRKPSGVFYRLEIAVRRVLRRG